MLKWAWFRSNIAHTSFVEFYILFNISVLSDNDHPEMGATYTVGAVIESKGF